MGQVLNMPMGTLRLVQGSGSGKSWATASAPVSALLPYLQEGMQITSAQTFVQIMDRGRTDHHIFSNESPIKLQFTVQSTGAMPLPATASGASVPFWHAEYKATQPEVGTGLGTGRYIQLYGGVIDQWQHSEKAKGNEIQVQMTFLGMSGFNGSGYLS